MSSLNKFLKIVMILSACLVLFLMISLPHTDCQACELEYEGKTIDGYEAFDIFEEACISYNRPENNELSPDEIWMPTFNEDGELVDD